MDEKRFERLSRGYMILVEAYYEKRGRQIIDYKVALEDDPEGTAPPEAAAS